MVTKVMTMKKTQQLAFAAVALATFLAPRVARAAEAQADASVSTDDLGKDGKTSDSSAFLAAGKVGGIVPFGHMKPFVAGAVELGWIFGGTKQRIGALLDVSYTTPKQDSTEKDPRVPTGSYTWKLTQKELVLQPTFLYRFTGLGKITPYAGIGPRIYFLETDIEGTGGSQAFMETKEKSTKFGVGLPLGAELALGPGGLFAEVLLQYGPLDHRITGDTNTGGATLWLGYRALL